VSGKDLLQTKIIYTIANMKNSGHLKLLFRFQ